MSFVPPTGPATATTLGTIKLTGDLGGTATAPTVPNAARVTGGGVETVSTNSAATGSVTLNLANGNIHNITLTGNVSFSFTGATAGKACSFTLYLTQGGAGGHSVSWPAVVKWSGAAPSVTQTAGATDAFVFETITNGSVWYGSLVGNDYK